ncbi:MAG: CPBP family intramembrane glutamic endopeptidase [Solirubrobacteraceae bacterium]
MPPAPNRAADVPPWPVWTAPAGVAVGLALGAIASVLVDVAAGASGSSVAHPPAAVLIIGDVVFDLGFVAAALYFASMRGRAKAVDFGFRRVKPGSAVKAVALGAIAYYGLTAVYAAIFKLSGRDKLPSELGVGHSTTALVAASIFVCVIAPIAEEFFFRGFFFGVLRSWRIEVAGRNLGIWLAAVVTGILFGLAHTGSASSQYLIPLGFLGFVLCIVRWRTGSLYPCIVLHSANNALALGYNQLGWNAAEIVALMVASWAVIAAITWPLGARSPRIA